MELHSLKKEFVFSLDLSMCVSYCLIRAKLSLIYKLAYYQDIAGTLATEIPEDSSHVAKLRSALESVDHKRRKVII